MKAIKNLNYNELKAFSDSLIHIKKVEYLIKNKDKIQFVLSNYCGNNSFKINSFENYILFIKISNNKLYFIIEKDNKKEILLLEEESVFHALVNELEIVKVLEDYLNTIW